MIACNNTRLIPSVKILDQKTKVQLPVHKKPTFLCIIPNMFLHLIFAVLGFFIGMLINSLADFLPTWRRAETAVSWQWTPSGLWQLVRGQAARRRPWLVELSTLLLFAVLPALIPAWQNLLVNSFHIAVLILIIVIDLENRLIFDIVIYPATIIALLGSFVVTREENSIRLALVGAVTGFVIFGLLYMAAQWRYGAGSGALGAGDVKLALAMGAMLGFHRILFALGLGILLGGVISFLLLLSRRVNRQSHLPYGQYLATAAIIMLIWGAQLAQRYMQPV